ncbi:MAG: hypothetical protein WKG07_08090 [Hymenobacter sp.]
MAIAGGTLTKFKVIPAAPGAASPTLVVPAETQVLETATPLVGANQAAVTNGSFVYDEHYRKRETFDAYTPGGQLLQRSHVPRQPTVYLWGYRRQYPIAEIRNATYPQVVAVLGQATIDELAGANPGSDVNVQQKLQPLRTQLKQAQVLTYTYDPLVGMTSQTDPTGRTVTYEYDALGRLIRTRDEQGRILSQQQYHYAGK